MVAMARQLPLLMPSTGRQLIPLDELAALGAGGRLELVVPLTPTQNTWDRSHAMVRHNFRGACLVLLQHQVRIALGAGYPQPWADQVELAVHRCSMGTVRADAVAIESGVKGAIDCLLLPRPKLGRPGVGLIPDDTTKHITSTIFVDEARGHWTRPGPGTWLLLRMVS